MKQTTLLACAALAIALAPVAASAATIAYSEGFNDSGANVTLAHQPDVLHTFVDYSNMTVGATNFSVPESPRMISGSADTRGLLLQANLASGAASAINVLAGNSPQIFSGNYKVSFDAWINVADPLPSGSTEQLLWGVGTDSGGNLEARNTRSGAAGIWGWLAGENGYGTEDAAIYVDATEAADLGDTQPGENSRFNSAFTTNFGLNNAPANSWVQVDVYHIGVGPTSPQTLVKFNGVTFFNIPLSAADGAAMLGYEDPFSSISDAPDSQWGLFDNFVVEQLAVPEPASLALIGLGLVGLAGVRRRS